MDPDETRHLRKAATIAVKALDLAAANIRQLQLPLTADIQRIRKAVTDLNIDTKGSNGPRYAVPEVWTTKP